jgi:hypothetical protein
MSVLVLSHVTLVIKGFFRGIITIFIFLYIIKSYDYPRNKGEKTNKKDINIFSFNHVQ